MKLALKPENLAQLVFFIRGEKVMLDSDLAMLYGVSTKALNQAFRRNKQRFPSDFAFQLSKEEFHHLRSQIVTSSLHGGRHYHPLRLYGTRRCHAIERAAKFASGAAFIVFCCFPAGNHCRLVNGHVGIRCANWRRNVELASPVIPE